MKNKMLKLKSALVSMVVVAGLAAPAWAEMPQTDTALVEQLTSQSSDETLSALAMYYDLHVSELEVQLMREQNTGAFLAARRAEGDGDTAEAKRQMDIFEATKAALAAARESNQALRQQLATMTDIAFDTDLAMAPDAPDALPAAPSGAPSDLLDLRNFAWGQVEQARKHLAEVRLQLLADQEEYDRTRKVKIGDSMRAMTKAEVAMSRAACDWRLIEAKIAVAVGKPVSAVLGEI